MVSSSLGIYLDGCNSNPHSSTTPSTAHDIAQMQASRLSRVTPGTSDVIDRFVGNSTSSHDHEARMRATLAALTPKINGPSTSSRNNTN
ncbi:hypothetical protein F4779DRAFT_485781 [Xylariaceae sp. FL0662B]|nr:hypothetical protein F4779DRAFT_485781 [Xylariaceae sp. FL0662B]